MGKVIETSSSIPGEFARLKAGYQRVFNIPGLMGTNRRNWPVQQLFSAMWEAYARDDMQMTAFTHHRLVRLLHELKTLKANNSAVFYALRKPLLSDNLSNFYGARMELHIAHLLGRKGWEYTKQEKPDFSVEGPSGPFTVECTSAYITAHKDHGVLYKIGAAVRGKGQKDYMNRSCLIAVECTNIFYHHMHGGPIRLEEVRDALLPILIETPAGGVLLSCYIFDTVGKTGATLYTRIDHPECAPELLGYLNTDFPTGGSKTHSVFLPNFA